MKLIDFPATRMRPLAAFAGAALCAALLAACERPAVEGENEARAPQPERFARQDEANLPPAPPTAQPAPEPGPDVERAIPPADAISDTVITGRVKTAILTDPAMAGADVSVNTHRGEVSLAGSVKSQEQTAIASAHAQRQDGVLRVDNELTMYPQ